jgi:AraC-like DNA-binding protein
MAGENVILGLDTALRGGAGVLLLLVAGLLVRDHGRTWAARLGALFALGAATFAAGSAVGLRSDGSLWRIALLALSSGNNVVFWLFARALFDDAFRPRPWQAMLWASVVVATLVCGLVLQPLHSAWVRPVDDGLALAALGFAVLAVVQTVSSWSADLVERRRGLRVVVVGASAGYIALTALANLLGLGRAAPQAVSLAGAAGLALIAVGVAWSFLGVAGGEALFPARKAEAAATGPVELNATDRQLLADIERAMRLDRAYRQDGLTIGALALKHGTSEHRLRRLINKGLGHRNFNSFLNSYRIADARAGLADPEQAAVPILTIALDAGFRSLGPFNRAFRLETGTTPSDYRRKALAGPAPERAIAVSASRIRKSA